MVPTQCILRARRVSDYAVLWASLSQRWGSNSAPALGTNFGHGAGKQDGTDRSSRRRSREAESSSGGPYTRSGAVTDGENVSTLIVESREHRKRARRAEPEASPVSMASNGSTEEQMRLGKATTVLEMHTDPVAGSANTTITRTVQTGAITRPGPAHVCVKIGIDSDSEEDDTPSTGTCHYSATPTSSYRSTEVDQSTTGNNTAPMNAPHSSQWRLGKPYYRDGPEQPRASNLQRHIYGELQQQNEPNHPPGIGPIQMTPYNPHNGHLAVPQAWHGDHWAMAKYLPYVQIGNAGFDPRWNSPRSDVSLGRNGQWTAGWSPPSSLTGSPMHGQATPPSPAIMSGHAGHGSNTPEQTQMTQNATRGECSPFLPRPTAKRAIAHLRRNSAHGDRAKAVTEARRLWARLDESFPSGPEDPEEGFGPEEIELARMGKIYVQIALGESTTKAWKYWRSVRMSLLHNGGGR